MEIDNFPFEGIIQSQIENKDLLNKKEKPPENGISLTIINNTVKHSKCTGTKYQKRKKQIINMFQDVVKKYKLKKSYINITIKFQKIIVLIFTEKKEIMLNFYYPIQDLSTIMF